MDFSAYPDSEAGVAFALFRLIANMEGWGLNNLDFPPGMKVIESNEPAKQRVLSLYDECRQVVEGTWRAISGSRH